MVGIYAGRMRSTQKSFVREILKVTEDPSIISFAGGLPNAALFPAAEISAAASKVLSRDDRAALQYSTSEGCRFLREVIAARYMDGKGIEVDPENIIITTGSQQGLDLTAKVFVESGDRLLIERPGYLGAIQAFSLFQPEFVTVPLENDGPDLNVMEDLLRTKGVKIFYAIPNFQNPSGVTYSLEKREAVARLVGGSGAVLVEDDPYGELRFVGEDLPNVGSFLEERKILLGTVSKIVAPGFRIGWVVADRQIMDRFIVAKQAADLHTSTFAQRVMYQYLVDNDINEHIEIVRESYRKQCDLMVRMIELHFPEEVSFTRPEGGMFLWVTLPERCSSMDLFEMALAKKVAFVPGMPFFVDGEGNNTLRLNFSNSDEGKIEEGIRRLAGCIKNYL